MSGRNPARRLGLLVLAAIHLTPAVGLAGAAALQRDGFTIEHLASVVPLTSCLHRCNGSEVHAAHQ